MSRYSSGYEMPKIPPPHQIFRSSLCWPNGSLYRKSVQFHVGTNIGSVIDVLIFVWLRDAENPASASNFPIFIVLAMSDPPTPPFGLGDALKAPLGDFYISTQQIDVAEFTTGHIETLLASDTVVTDSVFMPDIDEDSDDIPPEPDLLKVVINPW
jgi:hypothetical protein